MPSSAEIACGSSSGDSAAAVNWSVPSQWSGSRSSQPNPRPVRNASSKAGKRREVATSIVVAESTTAAAGPWTRTAATSAGSSKVPSA